MKESTIPTEAQGGAGLAGPTPVGQMENMESIFGSFCCFLLIFGSFCRSKKIQFFFLGGGGSPNLKGPFANVLHNEENFERVAVSNCCELFPLNL